jgi:4-hydroxybenzoate polyprenyltransferase
MLHKLRLYADFIKIEHTLFALPFAYAGALLAAEGWFGWRIFILILTAFTGLRTAAMSFNRIIDREIDAKNPRTMYRHLPAGLISLREAYTIATISLAVYFLSAYFINETAFLLSPIPAITAYVYPYLKRYTCLSHFVLGLNLAYAPGGGWVSVTNSVDIFGSEFVPFILGIAVIFWVAGFDMIYALQDVEFDKKYGLHSLPAHFGEEFAVLASETSHAVFFLLLLISFAAYGFDAIFKAGLVIIAILLVIEHYIVRTGVDEKRIQISFFYLNAAISATLLLSIAIGTIL